MFDRLKKVFSSQGTLETAVQAKTPESPFAQWAALQGLSYQAAPDGKGFAMNGLLAGKACKIERGGSSREYIRGEELKARAELQVNEDVVVLVITAR